MSGQESQSGSQSGSRVSTRLGHYELIALLGAGGMGEVYRARDLTLDREVAVKLLPPGVQDDRHRLERFAQEARAAARLSHPNILVVHELGEVDSDVFLVSELLEGQTLRQRVARGALPWRKAVDYASQLCAGLAAAHERGIVHCDLKPENLFITGADRVKILDFGLARLTEDRPGEPAPTATLSLYSDAAIRGTLGYLAPEQVRRGEVDQRADLFALGAILYEMLCGRRAFPTRTAADALAAILTQDPPPLPETIPSALARIVERCLEKEPAARFRSAHDLGLALEAVAATSEPAALARFGAAISRRQWRAVAAGAVALGVLIVAFAAGSHRASRARSALADSPPATAGTARAGRERLPNSIAVLPFVNISNDPDNDYFCDGISEEILNALSEFGDLNVIGRTSSFAFKGSNADIDRISAVLGVSHVLQGSVRKEGNRLRISAQLLDHTGRQLWTQTFDREQANVFDIQEQIARAVATTTASRVVPRPSDGYHPNVEAYDHFLAGRELLHQRKLESALQELERAIDLDPAFAEAHAEWAIGRLIGDPSAEDLEAGRTAIERALELQPKLLRAQAARGLLLMQSRPRDPEGAETVLRGALEQDPNMSDALLWLSNSLEAQGREDEALEVLQRGARIDPLHPSIAGSLAGQLWAHGKVEQAINLLERQLEQPNPGNNPYFVLSDMYRQMGRLADLHAVGSRVSLQPEADHDYLALSYALLGNWSAAQYWEERTPRDFPSNAYRRFFASTVPAWQGRAEEAVRRFQNSLDAGGIDIAQQGVYIQGWYGALLARAGRHAEAIAILEPIVGPQGESLAVTWTPEFNIPHALAWAYLNSGAGTKAETLLAAIWRGCGAALNEGARLTSGDLHYCAETALLQGERDRALELLEQAVTAGWREYYIRQHDPYWAALEPDPRYQALMATVKADVDRQAVEIARIDAAGDLVAKVDAAVAERRSREEQSAGRSATP
jgi:TolB-like protein/tetratricopeptide (TPR) repeat protein